MIDLAERATRVDQSDQYREEVAFVDVGGTPMFSVTHLPRSPIGLGLVVCPPILMDFLKNYRHEVLLARALAAGGVAVQRFHYRGTGHSGGDDAETTPEIMVEDALVSAARLRKDGIKRIAFMGTRWGARVAVAAADTYGDAPLLLWEPVASPARYVRELLMGRLLRETKDPRFAGAPTAGEPVEVDHSAKWTEELSAGGRVDVLGYALRPWLYTSMSEPTIDALLHNAGPRSVCLVQIGPWNTLRPDLMKVQRAVENASGTCEVVLIRDEPGWMFAGHRLKDSDQLVRVSADWVRSQAGVSGRA